MVKAWEPKHKQDTEVCHYVRALHHGEHAVLIVLCDKNGRMLEGGILLELREGKSALRYVVTAPCPLLLDNNGRLAFE